MNRSTKLQLLKWYGHNKRPLPWRQNRDPYKIWISEVMLQQTTATAVIPYFEKFIRQFPTLECLAKADQSDVYALWAGLGYYSRARSLLRAAQQLQKLPKFPQNYLDLIELPGFGPYTARAVASLAFAEPVGVLDGNVIRVLCRYLNWSLNWWKPMERARLQTEVDLWVKGVDVREFNQALMELGASVCRPRNPQCWTCPLAKGCQAREQGNPKDLPLTKPKRIAEVWWFTAHLHRRGEEIWLVQREDLPFLKSHWMLPGPAKKRLTKPKLFSFRHGVTHHDIYVSIARKTASVGREPAGRWVSLNEVAALAPSSLIKKILSLDDKSAAVARNRNHSGQNSSEGSLRTFGLSTIARGSQRSSISDGERR